MNPLLFSNFTATGCIGAGLGQTLDAQCSQHGGLAFCQKPISRVPGNSFGFGGSNCCLAFGRAN